MINKELLHLTDVILILCNTPDETCAQIIARELVSRQLAACVNILAPCRSVYRWEDVVEETVEIPLVIKTTQDAYILVQEVIQTLHSYKVPEIVALPFVQGLPVYLDWVRRNVSE